MLFKQHIQLASCSGTSIQPDTVMRSFYQDLCPIFCNTSATHSIIVPYLSDTIYSESYYVLRQWCFFEHCQTTCSIESCVDPQIFGEVYRQPSLDPVCRYVMLLHDPIAAIYQISYLCINAFGHIWDGIPAIHHQFCYRLGILYISLFRTVIIELLDLLD